MIRTFIVTAAGAAIAVAALVGAADAQSAAAKKATTKIAACKTIKAEADCGARTDCRWATAYVVKKTSKSVPAQCKAKPAPKKIVKKVAKKAA